MRIKINDAPQLPLPITDPEAGTIVVSFTVARDARSQRGRIDKCEMATIVGVLRRAVESSDELHLAARETGYVCVDVEAYDEADDCLVQDKITLSGLG